MARFVMEHLPRSPAVYEVRPLSYEQAKTWIKGARCTSLVRTTELIGAICAGMGVRLKQSEESMSLNQGDEAVLITLSYGVLLAWAEGNIAPLPEDWRCSLLVVKSHPAFPDPVFEAALTDDPLPRSTN